MQDYDVVQYKGKKYCVGRYIRNKKPKLFVFDHDDLDKVNAPGLSYYWVNGYVGHSKMDEGLSTQYYLHNIVMGKAPGGGKGQEMTYDHINRNTHDNRRENLRLVSQTSQNENQNTRKRNIKLPKNCGFTVEDIPKCVYYRKEDGAHGEHFYIEVKKNGKKVLYEKTSCSKDVSLKDKWIHAKVLLLDLVEKNPKIFKGKNITVNFTDEQFALMRSYNRILEKSKYDCVQDNLIKIPEKKVLKANIEEASPGFQAYLKTIDTSKKKTGKKHGPTKLPPGCGVTDDMIPKYCYYTEAKNGRGDKFTIDKRHPNAGGSSIPTNSKKGVSTLDKFKELQKNLAEIEKNPRANVSKKKSPKKKSTKKADLEKPKLIKHGSKTSIPKGDAKSNTPKKNNSTKVKSSTTKPIKVETKLVSKKNTEKPITKETVQKVKSTEKPIQLKSGSKTNSHLKYSSKTTDSNTKKTKSVSKKSSPKDKKSSDNTFKTKSDTKTIKSNSKTTIPNLKL